MYNRDHHPWPEQGFQHRQNALTVVKSGKLSGSIDGGSECINVVTLLQKNLVFF